MKLLKLFSWMLLLLLARCAEDECEPQSPQSDDLDMVEDLVAYLNPNDFIQGNVLLYYQPPYLDDVIRELGAQPVTGDTFRMRAPTIAGGDSVELIFIATPVSTPFFFTAEDDDSADEIVAKHKVYKNAQCKETVPPIVDTSCLFIKEWGQYVNSEIYGWNQCKKGTAFCLELERVVGIHKVYEDTLCSILVKTEDIINFSCDKK